MDLEKMEIVLLIAIYEKEYNFKKIDWEALGFDSNNQKAFYLQRLERYKLIELESNVLVPGGQRDQKYGTAIAMVWSDGIHITEKGVEEVKKYL